MTDSPAFNTFGAVRAAYWALFARFDRLLYFVVIWLAAGAVFVLGLPELLERSTDGRSGFERMPPRELVSALGEGAVMIAASISTSIAWHRWIILGEPMDRIWPERTDIIAAYTWRSLVFILVPILVTVVVLVAMAPYNGGLVDDGRWIEGYSSAATLVILAAIARCQLAFAASAVADWELTFRASWRLTAGYWWPLFWGYVAAVLPFTAIVVVLRTISFDLDADPVAQSTIDNLASVIGVMGGIVCAAFLSYAYLHFTTGRPSARAPAGYFN